MRLPILAAYTVLLCGVTARTPKPNKPPLVPMVFPSWPKCAHICALSLKQVSPCRINAHFIEWPCVCYDDVFTQQFFDCLKDGCSEYDRYVGALKMYKQCLENRAFEEIRATPKPW